MSLTKSYFKVQYDLRPAKQAERRMLLDAFLRLARAGFPIQSYQYTGMGSIHFTDFILFHKYLGLTSLLSVEAGEDIERRVAFNVPFNIVKSEIGLIGDQIPNLSPDQKHLLWLDYDCVVTEECLQDIVLAASHLPPQSILLVTLDAEPPGSPEHGPKEWKEHFVAEASDYLDANSSVADFTRDKLPDLCRTIVYRAMSRGIQDRDDLRLAPLFNFEYADGHRMITLGGMICSGDDECMLPRARFDEVEYYRNDLESAPFKIQVPILTRRERLYPDAKMPCAEGWIPADFELSSEEVRLYRSIYRYLPTYAELLI